MKKLLILIASSGLLILSCNDTKMESTKEESVTHIEKNINIVKNDSTVMDSTIKITLLNPDGKKLDVTYKNDSAYVHFDGKDLVLKQDLMASGTQYSNDHFQLSEHQGDITLTEDNKIIFSIKAK